MKVSVIGGLDRREKEYKKALRGIGMDAKVYTKNFCNFEQSIKCSNCVILLTPLCSHNMASKAKKVCKRFGIPILFVDKKSPDAVTGYLDEYMKCEECQFAHLCKRGN
jgi:hypothetical protein